MAAANLEQGSDTLSLNIMPTLDVFSILICFLLISFSTDPVSHDIAENLELPDSKTIVALDELPTITVTKSEIRINDKVVASILGGDLTEKDIQQGAAYPVFVELEKLAKATTRVAKLPSGEKKKAGTLAMEMDKSHRFKLMKRIMLAAQQAEFVTFKLMVAKENN